MVLPRFSITTPSRHPAEQVGYDPHAHRYRADYVNPKFWVLNLDGSPGLPKNSDGSVQVPNEVTAYRWTVKEIGGAFSKGVVNHKSSDIWKADIQIPHPGKYEITLQIDLKNAPSLTSTRRYRLRDFLIVGIGDSFAAGQGNPDVPAVPTSDQEVTCQATTLRADHRPQERHNRISQGIRLGNKSSP